MDPTRTFRIDRCLGRGGFGEVYRATMSRAGGMDREVALKVLRRDIDPDGQAVRRLRDEGRLLATIRHPTILTVHDLVLLDDRIALVTEFVDGHDLTRCLEPPDPLPPRALLMALSHLTGALEAAWETRPQPGSPPLRMVHRDIKPSNVRISSHGQVKLLDFGIARTDAVDRESRTRTGMMVGSPAYMAPERFIEHEVLVESDVFSMGTILFEGLVGERFYGTLPLPMQVGLAVSPERYADHLASRMERIQDDALRELTGALLAWTPRDRPGPAELGSRLDALADTLRGPTLERWCRHRDWAAPEATTGELDGRTVVEGLLVPPTAGSLSSSLLPGSREALTPEATLEQARPIAPPSPVQATEQLAPPRGGRLVAVLGLGFALVASVSIGAGVAVGTLVYASTSAEPEPSALAPVETPEIIELEQPEPKPEPEPEPQPPLQRPPPLATPAVRTAPRDEPPPPGPIRGARVSLVGADAAFAVSAAGRVRLPAHLTPGRYTIEAVFNGAPAKEAGTLDVVHGTPVTLKCSPRISRCK